MSVRRLARSVMLAVAIAALPSVAAAHPLGNFSINHYARVTVAMGTIAVDLVIDLAEIPTIDALPSLDTDSDGFAEPDELVDGADPACRTRAADLRVAVDGQQVPLAVEDSTIALAPGAGGLQTMRITCVLAGTIGHFTAATSVAIADAGDPDRIGWREIVVRGDGVTIDPDATRDVSRALTAYPDDLLERPLDERSTTVTVNPSGPGTVALGAGVGASAGGGDASAVIDIVALSPAGALVGIFLAALTGAGHALTPGHGKTLVAAYLVGTRGRTRDAMLLGLAVTSSHTIGVLAMAAVVLLGGSALPADRLYPVLSGISGLLIVGIGAWLLIGCLRKRGSHDHDHQHGPAHEQHDHSHPHPHTHAEPGVGRGGLVAIGLAGGMIPSPAALVLLLGAIAAGQPAYGLLLALAFGAGMAAVFVTLGLLVVRGRARMMAVASRLPGLGRLAPAVPWVAAIVVVVGGVALTGGAVAAAI